MARHSGTTLVLQSSDGNLVVYNGSNDIVLWGTNQEWEGPPDSNLRDYYAKVIGNGVLKLVGIDAQYGEETVYVERS